ncbi:MAG: hypothetical protein V4604_13680 [Bacteroidota bacterium]
MTKEQELKFVDIIIANKGVTNDYNRFCNTQNSKLGVPSNELKEKVVEYKKTGYVQNHTHIALKALETYRNKLHAEIIEEQNTKHEEKEHSATTKATANFEYKWRWVPHILSGLAVVISIWSLFTSGYDDTKLKNEVERLKLELQELKTQTVQDVKKH